METNWFEMWFKDKEAILSVMISNMQSDLNAGYDYFGKSITQQRADIDEYKKNFDRQMDDFKNMDEKKIARWCKYDMIKRGVISA